MPQKGMQFHGWSSFQRFLFPNNSNDNIFVIEWEKRYKEFSSDFYIKNFVLNDGAMWHQAILPELAA